MALLAGVLAARGALAAVSLNASLDRPNVYLGESATLTLEADGIDDSVSPDLSGLRDCTATFVDSVRKNIEQRNYINGRHTVIRFNGRVFTYRVTPTRAGRIRIGPIAVAQDGRTASLPGPELDVLPVEPQDRVLIHVQSSRRDVVVEEPFEVTVRLLVRRLPAPYAGEDPIDTRSPPVLSIPFVGGHPPAGLEGPDMQRLLSERIAKSSRDAGFGINNITLDDGSSLFPGFLGMSPLQRQTASFRFDRTEVRERDRDYFAYELRFPYRPTAAGDYTFGPVSVKGHTIVGATPEGNAQMQPVYAFAPSVTVTVADVPAAGRPATFIGAIGTSLEAAAGLDTQTCREGDPLTLTISFGGDIRLDRLTAPALGVQTNLLRQFRVYEDTMQSETVDGRRRYTCMIRPTSAGTLEIPPLAFSYFDTARRDYATVYTAPIPVRANRAVAAGIETVVGTQDTVAIGDDFGTRAELVPAPFLIGDTLTVSTPLFRTDRHLPLLALGPLVYGLAALTRLARRHLPTGRAFLRRHRAPRQALRALDAIDIADNELTHRACHAIEHVLRDYLGNRWRIPAGGLTPADAARHLTAHGIAPERSATLLAALHRGAEGAFAQTPLTPAELAALCDTARRGIADMEGGAV